MKYIHDKTHFLYALLMILLAAFLSAGCSGDSSLASSGSSSSGVSSDGSSDSSDESSSQKRDTVQDCLVPVAAGTTVYGNALASIDASNIAEGYVMVCYQGGADKAKLQITIPDGTVYTYTLSTSSYETFPLTGGDGNYHLDVLEHAYDDMYAVVFSQDISVALNDEFKPFLYPNQYVWFTQDTEAAALGRKLSDSSSGDLDYVTQVYNYVIENISYDKELAENVQSGYLPDVDATLASGKGICFDYASLMAAMLRSQSIPTKLVIGYSGEAYHAWISVYLKESGWVNNIIEFDGKSWSLMDPTLAANNSGKAVKKYIGDGSNYTEKYSY